MTAMVSPVTGLQLHVLAQPAGFRHRRSGGLQRFQEGVGHKRVVWPPRRIGAPVPGVGVNAGNGLMNLDGKLVFFRFRHCQV